MTKNTATLAENLVDTAVNEIINAPHDDYDVVDYEVAARGAVAAVLRALADDADYRSAEFNARELRIEADEIERMA